MRRLIVLALLAFAGCPGPRQELDVPDKDAEVDPPDATISTEAGPPQAVKVMNWNVLNLFNDVRDSLEIAEADEVIEPTAKYQAKLDAIATVLTAVAPDIAVLVEVENKAVLDDLGAKLSGYQYRHVTQGNDPRGIDIAVISKLPFDVGPTHTEEFFSASKDPTGQKFVFARDVLEAHLRVNQRHFAVLGIHYKAQDGAIESDMKRLAEAEQTKKIAASILVADASAAVVIAGDFNDVPGSEPIAALELGQPIFASATADLLPADRFSVTFGGNPQLFDDQLCDPSALGMLDKASVAIRHDNDVDAASDHDPVVATYNVR